MPDGTAIANLRIATTESWTDKKNPKGERMEHTEWHRVAFWGRQAEVIHEYMRKGSKIYVEGSLRTRKWQDKEGNDRYSTKFAGGNLPSSAAGAITRRHLRLPHHHHHPPPPIVLATWKTFHSNCGCLSPSSFIPYFNGFP